MKLCDLVFFFVVAAGSATLPKLTTWLASPQREDQERAVASFHRLNHVQALIGCGAALGYLAFNDWFVAAWFGPRYQVPLLWQWTFALNLAITAGSAAAVQIASRCGENGLRISGLMVGITGLINLILSFAAMKLGSIFGIALATVMAQSFFSLRVGHFVCRFLAVPYGPWLMRNWVLPAAVVSIGYGAREIFDNSLLGVAACGAVFLVLLGVVAVLTKITPAFLREEWRIVRGMFRR